MGARERFVARLRERAAGRSQAAVARELGIDQASMSRYLRGKRPSVNNARRIALRYPELADVLTDWLLWDDCLGRVS